MDKKGIISVVLSIIIATTAFASVYGGIVRQQKVNTQDISCLQSDLIKEISERKDDSQAIMIKLAEIDTNILYIKEYLRNDK